MSLFMLIAAAAAAGTAQAPQAVSAKDDSEKIVCKSERFVGSHLSERVCKTRGEWEAGRKSSKDALNKFKMVKPAGRSMGQDSDPGPPSRNGPPR